MAPDSPRGRIDQFFPLKKKRKVLSQDAKSGRPEKEARCQIEGSPSTKASLESYLEVSKNDYSSAKCLSSILDQISREVLNLEGTTLDSGVLPRNENEDAHTQQSEIPGASGCAQEVKCDPLSDICSAGTNNILKESLETANTQRNSELKEFATGFLSIYCSEVQNSVKLISELKESADGGHTNSTNLQLEERPMKRRHFENDGNQSNIQNESISSPNPSKVFKEPQDTNSNCLHKGVMCTNSFATEATMRKCSFTDAPCVAECVTPGTFTIRPEAQETPKSRRRSSFFSPGEEFWNEAILVADGFVAPNDVTSLHITEKSENVKHDHKIHNSSIVDCESSRVDGGFIEMACDVGSAACSLDTDRENRHKEVSPLPVKHIDFGFEAKQFGKDSVANSTRPDNFATKPDNFATKHNTVSSTHHRNPQSEKHMRIHPKDQMDEVGSDIQGINSACIVPKRDNAQSNNVMVNTPDRQYNNIIAGDESKSVCTPASVSSTKNSLDLSRWLPPEICDIYNKKGISKLYSWQVDCLQVDGVLQNRNLVYCASTSAGKSFVAEILMLRRVLSTGKIALLVLPYVSICAEKAEHLEVLLEPVGKHVRSFYGNQGGGTLPKDTSVAVCTIEKANSLINRLLEESRLSELGTIVIDELHMVGDQSRGYLLELLLTKLRYAAGEGSIDSSSGESTDTSSGKFDPARGLQIVGMSATLSNVAAVANWLQAALYETDFRPVPLEEYVKVGSTIYNKDMKIIRTIPKVADLGGKDPDHIVELCNEVVQEGHSVLIFCSSRKGCESTAKHIAKYLLKFSASPRSDQGEPFDIASAIDSLRRSPAGLDPILEETLPSGVAYHHAGLTVEERETVETCYRKGLVRVLTATSTLAAGVNLPARRVIFRQPRIGRDFIDGTRYRQMAGRAGRTGIDTQGESVLICKPEETKKILALLNDSCPPLHSCLSEDRNGMTHAILEVVAGGIVQTASDIHRYVRCTLLNSTKPFEDVVKSAQDSLRWLCHKKFLEWSEETKLYTTTPLGWASFGSSLCPEESLIVLDDLVRAREGFVLASDLHMVYLVTPINVDVEPDWELYYERFMQLSLLDKSVGNRVGVQEPFLMRMAHGAPLRTSHKSREKAKGFQGGSDQRVQMSNHGILSDDQMLRVCKRFYVALILSRLVQEAPVGEVCDGFKVARGMVQALQENAGRFASMVAVFCERLGWNDLESLVAKFQNRVSFGVRAEIVELTAIPYIKGSRARALYKAGLRTPQAIAEASIPEITKALFESSSWSSHSTAQRKMQMGIAKKIKNGARKIVLDKAEEARLAAFSAFKSLGLDMPHLSRPISFTATGNDCQKDLATSSGDESTSSYAIIKHNSNSLDVPMSGNKCKINRVISEAEEEGGLASSMKENASGFTQCEVPIEKPIERRTLLEEYTKDLNNKVNSFSYKEAITSHPSLIPGCPNNQSDECRDLVRQKQPTSENICMGRKESALEMGPANAASIPGGVDSFLNLWDSSTEFFFDIHYTKKSEMNSIAPFEIHGIAICWEASSVYYLNIPKDLFRSYNKGDHQAAGSKDVVPKMETEMATNRWGRIGVIMGKENVRKFSWNLKVQIQVLRSPAIATQKVSSLAGGVKNLGLELIENTYIMFPPVHVRAAIDMCIVAWILSPDEEKNFNLNLEKEVKRRLSSEAAASANRSGRWKDQMRRVAHNGCCRRVAQTRALFSVLWKLLESEELVEPLMNIEVQLTKVLADMEFWGIGVDMEGCLRARHILGRKLKLLEKEAYKLAGKTFSLSMPADIANILYEHLKLPMPEGYRGKQHHSTDKHCLDILRNEHPIVPVIKEHRTLAKLLNCTLGSICSLAKLSNRAQKYTLHGHWLQTSTATGRLSMEDPNLQNVEHMVEFRMDKDEGTSGVDDYKINARDYFVPTQDDWLLLTADYSQIELRLMAHFSKDNTLIKLLSSAQADVFTMIAAKWSEKDETIVSLQEREQTKKLVYGLLYGMGPNTLSEQLQCSPDEASEKIQNFKRSFPGVASWLQEVVTSCRNKGYVKTLKGRKRFLTKIKFGNSKEKSKAQRQAVNSICQGSAADIIKVAMIRLHGVLCEDNETCDPSFTAVQNFQMLKGRCRILLQVHDELVLEADPSVIKEAGLLLKTCMESAVSLLVPLPVKSKIGRTWGSLEPFEPN
ncbi:helicase and polymerase-containing protein TEBICHI [Andrographis paniculata]|uniref:helicase and polymerase-containing protein TEBICHI n=1 Tax=Andrographis paniculata TaxID=175694 RepID=UPI0021E6FC2D|nr:helicase and polymerase-containing protein TEBICHI [Andrographis paniculata]